VEAPLTLNPDGTYARNPDLTLPKPSFLTSERTEDGWSMHAEWFLGRIGSPVYVTMYCHPTEGVSFRRHTGDSKTGVQVEESPDWRDLLGWLIEEAR
jgi:hypothetical protein